MRNIKLTIQFDGTGFHGWQIQENAVTIQEELQNAVLKVTGQKPNIIGCGRTDSGVHAQNYVCNFKTESEIPSAKLPLALNFHLPEGIICKSAEDEAFDFHAKGSAKGKLYTYYIDNARFKNVFTQKYRWHYRKTLDTDKMQQAAKHFIGTHDFAGFASSGLSVQTTIRTIYSLDVEKEGDDIKISVHGNGFLYNMVRIIAGTLVWVGEGKINAYDIPDIIASCDRTRAGITAPPQGLFLTEVYY